MRGRSCVKIRKSLDIMGYLLALLICTGPLKFILNYYFSLEGTMFDLTIATLLAVVLSAVYRTVVKGESVNQALFGDTGIVVFVIGIFFVLYLLSIVYSVSDIASLEKLKRVSFLTVPSFFIPLLFFRAHDLKGFLRGYAYIVTGIALWTLGMFLTYGQIIYTTSFEVQVNHLLPGTLFGACIVMLIVSQTEKLFFSKGEIIILLVINLIALVANGSRGPIIFGVLTLCIYYIFVKRRFKHKLMLIKSMVIFSLIISLTGLFIPNLLLRTVGRFSKIYQAFEGIQTMGISRLTHIEKALTNIDLAPVFGYGLGSYGVVAFGIDDVKLYPHNIFLEIWFELGFVGLALFLVFIAALYIVGINRIRRESEDSKPKKYLILFALLCFYFLGNHLKSLDLIGFRIAGVFLGIFMSLQTVSFTRYLKSNYI